MLSRTRLLLGTALFAALPLAAQEAPLSRALTDNIDAVFAEYDRDDSPGCALGVNQGHQLAYARGYGMANLEFRTPLGPTSVFRIGSTSKQFTAATIALAAQRGDLSLDDDIRIHLPEMPEYDAPVTIRMLVHHTSGIRDYLGLMSLAGLRNDDWYSVDEALAMIARQQETNFTPGTQHLYSNSGYFLLSQIIERATGKTLREYAQEHIFQPLGMTNTHFHDDHTEIVPNRASGYAPAESGFDISMTTLDMVGDGGVFTTIEDMRRWDENFYDPVVGGDEFIQTMLTPGVLTSGEELDYALGLVVNEYRGLPTVRHGGAFVGFRAESLRFPDQEVTITVFCNLATTSPSRLADRVADVLLADRLGPRAEETAQAAPAAGPARASDPPVEPDATGFVGRFHSDELGVDYVITADGSDLFVKRGRGDPIRLRPTGEETFNLRGAEVRFERTGDAPDAFVIDTGRVRGIRFERVDR
jgi:CubicO group peptidase (beta-lactamase class C family)